MSRQLNPALKEPPSTRRAFVVIEVQISEALTNNAAHDLMIPAADGFIDDAVADGVPIELVNFEVVAGLNHKKERIINETN